LLTRLCASDTLVHASRDTITQIKGEIERLERAYDDCNDEGIRKVIQGWIEEQKQKLGEGAKEET